ncbi:hypothetical protein GALL_497320 [mine drainage metagenome]|uniref:Uncharacterized protein n=1 Tax=mine drainage metagenome TaxID=410659 RepID=A0A1J5PBU4_9ZZZZ
MRNILRDDHRIGACPLGQRQADRGNALPLALAVARIVPDPVLGRVGSNDDGRDVLDINRPPVPRRNQDQTDVGNTRQCLAGRDAADDPGFPDLACQERTIGVLHLGDELLQRDAKQRQLLGIRLYPDLLGGGAGDIGQSYTVDLRQLGAQFVGEFVEILVSPALGGRGLRRKRQHGDGDVVDSAPDNQRFGNANRNPVQIGPDLLMNAKDCLVGLRSDQEARSHHHAIVFGLAVDVFYPIDALDDRFQRFGHEFDRVGPAQPVGVDANIDQGNADLGLFLARNNGDCDEADHERGEQEQRRQRRIDRRPGEPPGQSEIHGCTSWSPGRMPDRISRPLGNSGEGRSRPRCTGTSMVRSA